MGLVNTATITQELKYNETKGSFRAKVRFWGAHYTREYKIKILGKEEKIAQAAMKKIVAEIADGKFSTQRDNTYKEENEISLGRKLITWDSKSKKPRFFHRIKVKYDVHALKTEGVVSTKIGSVVKQTQQRLAQANLTLKKPVTFGKKDISGKEASVTKVYSKAVAKTLDPKPQPLKVDQKTKQKSPPSITGYIRGPKSPLVTRSSEKGYRRKPLPASSNKR